MSKLRTIAVILTLSLLLFAPGAAFGDVINEPADNFYQQNAAACENVHRPYFVEATGGFALVLEEPGIGEELAEVPNGDTLYVLHTYEYEGELWGHVYVGHYMSETYKSHGWLPMSLLTAAYVPEMFVEEYSSEFYLEDADLSALETAMQLIAWTWPGSGIVGNKIEMALLDDYGFSHFYKDDQGREWGLLSNEYFELGWVCVSDPENADIEAFNAHPTPAPQVLPSGYRGSYNSYYDDGPNYLIPLIVVLVVVLVVATGVLIRLHWKKKEPPIQS